MAPLSLLLSVVISVLCYSTVTCGPIFRALLADLRSTGTWGTTTTPGYWWESTTASTTPPSTTSTLPPMFSSSRDRDSFIMQLSSEIIGIKDTLNRLSGEINHLPTHPSISSGTSQKAFVAFMVRLGHRLTGLGKDQIIHFDDVILNKGDGFDARLGVFRCPVAGTYQLSLFIGSYGGIQLEIVNNGQQIGKVVTTASRFGRDVENEEDVNEEEGGEVADDGDEKIVKRYYTSPGHGWATSSVAATARTAAGMEVMSGSTQTMVNLKVGDEVWVRHASDNQNDILFGDGTTTFSGHLLSLNKK